MATHLTTDSGADVTIYRFRDFLGAGTAALITTRFDHLLTEAERTGWTGYGDGDNDAIEYPPAVMSWEDHFDHTGERA
ncbi:hypothetical protein [Natronosalvus rutilus]|uniref:Uncharacterized protein n=1 Tax=Natronosalvus rutilus TaxID=2953753 RepID=A0A9E7ND22_9EURY|nr:hypothetical protein [Natronosalvus rutilus]UTF56042.1 hypothetical protein NGM29_20865 [Natronosalvus rutilus]